MPAPERQQKVISLYKCRRERREAFSTNQGGPDYSGPPVSFPIIKRMFHVKHCGPQSCCFTAPEASMA